MDFELEQSIILCYENVGQAAVCQEETQETIVPDACPDILRIVDVCAQAFPSRWEVREGQATVIGLIQASVLYMPENDTVLSHMDIRLPFSVQVDMDKLRSDSILEVCTRLRHADARILNPRKVLLRCDLIAEINAMQKKEFTICTGINDRDSGHLCQLQCTTEYEKLVSVPHRIFPLSEEIRLSGAQSPVLLASRAGVSCSECRLIGSKLIFKGKTDVELLLLAPDGSLEHRSESFPFSQILEAKGAGESGSGSIRLEISEFSCVQPLDDPFRLLIEAEILAMGQVRERDTVMLLADLYSTTHHTQFEVQPIHLYQPCEATTYPQTVRDLLETSDVVRGICDSSFQLGHIIRTLENDTLTLTAQGIISALYLDEDRQPRCVKKEIEVTTRVAALSGQEFFCHCICSGELFAAPCAGGIEVRMGIEFQIFRCTPTSYQVVSQAAQLDPRSCDAPRPSVILRLPESGERLWDIAKACGTTKEQIMQANELTDEEIPPHTMLLIPSVR